MLGLISIVVISVFGLMLTTSYAWYSYENASTKFDVVTANDEVEIIWQKGEYINTEVAIPIKSSEIDRYSDKYDFNIRVKQKIIGNEMVARISLVDVVIDDELKKIDSLLGDSPFRVDFFYQGRLVGNSISGANILSSSFEIGDVVLSDDIDNQFEFRVYLLDNGEDQSYLMNKKFQAKIEVNIVSRASTYVKSFDHPDIYVSDIVIDGNHSKSLPVSGLYRMNSFCEKGSRVLWDSYSKTLIYDKGSNIADSCKLEFTSSNDKLYLKDVNVGSYVKYVGSNGCQDNSCSGENANYVDKDNMGYCGDDGFHFHVSGWRVAYSFDDTAYLVSAGALECGLRNNMNSFDTIALGYCNSNYSYRGDCNSSVVHSLNDTDIEKMIGSSGIVQNDLVDNGGYYWYYNTKSLDGVSWNPGMRKFGNSGVSSYGIRPVIRIDSSVYVVGGAGTMDDPYVIYK